MKRIKALAEYLHERGLKLGIYSDVTVKSHDVLAYRLSPSALLP